MGRAPKRTFKARSNPLMGAAVTENNNNNKSAMTSVANTEEVPGLVEKLSSSNAGDRVWAAASASNLLLSDDPKVRRMLLANNVIGALLERMSDSEPDVVVQVTGALHNLAAVDQEAAEEISRKNVYAFIQTLIPKLAKSIDNIIKQNEEGKSLSTDDRKRIFQTTDNLISILWVLCETVPTSLGQINNMALLPFLTSFFNVIGKLPASLLQTAGQFLYTLTENNVPVQRALLEQTNTISTMFEVVDRHNSAGDSNGLSSVDASDLIVMRILAGGILTNIKPMALNQLEAAHNNSSEQSILESKTEPWHKLSKTILHVISGFLSFDIHQTADRMAGSINELAEAYKQSMDDGAITYNKDSEGHSDLDRIETQMNYVQLTLELAANIFTDEGATESEEVTTDVASGNDMEDNTDDDEEKEEEEDDDDDNDDDDDDDDDDNSSMGFDQDDMDTVVAAGENDSAVAANTESIVQQSVLGVFITAIIPLLQRLAEPTKMSTVSLATKACSSVYDDQIPVSIIPAVESMVALHERALNCFNNFFLVIEESLKPWFGLHTEEVNQWWSFLISIAQHLFEVEQVSKADLVQNDQKLKFAVLEPAIGCLWTLARCVKGVVPVTSQQIEGLIHVCEQAPTQKLRVMAVGVLGNIASRQPGHIEDNRRIGTYLLNQVVSDPLQKFAAASNPTVAAEPIIEALDLFYDIYGDMEYDYDKPVFVDGGFLPILRQLVGPMRKLAKTIDRRKHRSLRDRCSLVMQNLRGFIDYKASERAK